MKCKGFSGPCGKYKAVKYRTSTAYTEEARNFLILCPKCQEESRDYWAELWRQYHADVL